MDYILTDIHFHTNSSFDAYENGRNGKFDFDSFLENEKHSDNKLGLLVKTDHNILDYNYYCELKRKIIKKNSNLVLLPGIELNSMDDVHWIFIFDDLKLSENVENGEIGNLLDLKIQELFEYTSVIPPKQELERAQKSKADIGKFVSILNELEISFLAIPHLNKTKGFYNKLKSNKELLEQVEIYLNDNVISGFESKNHNEFLIKSILQTQKCIDDLKNKINQSDEDGIQRRENHLEFLKELKNYTDRNYVSSIYGSDFHGDVNYGMNKYEELKDSLFYMKSLPSFEGLRFALLDYNSRIFNRNKLDKYNKNDGSYLKRIVLKENGKEKSLLLGDGLNTIIGSRGSGKSYLVKAIIGDDENYNDTEIKSQIKVERLEFADGTTTENLNKEKYDILNQKGKKGSKNDNTLNIYELLAEAPYNTDKFLESIKSLITSSPVRKENINNFVSTFNTYLDCLQEEQKLFNNTISYDFLKEYNEYTKNQSDFLLIKDKFDSLTAFLTTNINEKKDFLSTISRDKEYADKLIIDLHKIEKSLEYDTLTKSNEITTFDILINELENFSKDSYQELSNSYKNNIGKIENVLNRSRKISNKLSNELSNKEKGYSEKFRLLQEFINTTITQIRRTNCIKEKLLESLDKDILDEEYINFTIGESNYTIYSYYKFNLMKMDDEQRDSFFENYKISPTSSNIEQLINLDLNDSECHETINYLFEEMVDGRRRDYHVKTPITHPEISIRNNTEQGPYENIVKMSPGQRSNLLLDMILQSTTDKILILDQPEDDLDNETIYKSIVNKLRDLKLRRQLIVITHNANIAINGDSDYLIVCQNSESGFSYWSDKMESLDKHNFSSINSNLTNVRQLEIAVTILDGGKEAIRKRVKSFGYKDLFLKGDN